MSNLGRWDYMIHPEKSMGFHMRGGPLLYQVRNRHLKQNILCGAIGAPEILMGIFFPAPYGIGTAPEANQYILENYSMLEYRTMKTVSYDEALEKLEDVYNRGKYIFTPGNWPEAPDTTGWRPRW